MTKFYRTSPQQRLGLDELIVDNFACGGLFARHGTACRYDENQQEEEAER